MKKEIKDYEREHLDNIMALAYESKKIYDNFINDISRLVDAEDFEGEEYLPFDKIPKLNSKIEARKSTLIKKWKEIILSGMLMENLRAQRKNQTINSLTQSSSNNNNSSSRAPKFSAYNIAKPISASSSSFFSKGNSPRVNISNAKVSSISISDRVWKEGDNVKRAIEAALNLGIKNVKSKGDIAREIRKYLKDPNYLYKQLATKYHGKLPREIKLIQHPGRGVYKDPLKNVYRLITTELNNAYRLRDYEMAQNNDYIVGWDIRRSKGRSKSHSCSLCHELEGKYPKDFLFTGWHPSCLCYALPIISPDGKTNKITRLPDNYLQRQKEQEQNQENETPKKERSQEQIEAIKKRWRLRKKENEDAKISIIKKYKSGGELSIMNKVDKNKKDYKDILSIARFYARRGSKVTILAPLNYKNRHYKRIYKGLMGTPYEKKCPDILIDNRFYEYESFERPFSKIKVKNMLTHASKQSNLIIIDNNKGASDRYILKLLFARENNKNGYPIKELSIYEKGKVRHIYKKASHK